MSESFLTKNSGAEQETEIKKTERILPIIEYRDSIVETIKQRPTTVIIGETGSGKTTEIPGFLLDVFPDKKIVITEPRRIATRSVAGYVAQKRKVNLGQEVGYRVRFDDHSSEGTMANFVTDGLLLQEMKSDPLLLAYDIVMIDEAHERSLNVDFLLGLLKQAQLARQNQGEKELKIVVTSATLEKEKFAEYFNEAPVVEVPGRQYPVNIEYQALHRATIEGVPDYVETAANIVTEIIDRGDEGDILIFMPRKAEILATVDLLTEKELPGVEIFPLYGTLAPEEQQQIFVKTDKRKVIVATNIAETSLTIDGVQFVIDSGLINEKDFDPEIGLESLEVRRHAQSGCRQRAGRAGRTAPGTCYRLYGELDYEKREPFQKPEIARSNLDHVILAMKKMGINDVINFDFIEPPKREAVIQAVKTLQSLGALDERENLTQIGLQMAEFPLRPELARMLIEAEPHGCLGSVSTIVSMIGEKSVFNRPKGLEEEADNRHLDFKDGNSDFMTLLNVWRSWERNNYNVQWARNNFLNHNQLFEAREVRHQLMGKLRKMRKPMIDTTLGEQLDENIARAISAGLINDLMVRESLFGRNVAYEKIVAAGEEGSSGFYIHPSSALFHTLPQYLIGHRVVQTSRKFARLCQAVDPSWLPEVAPQLFEEIRQETDGVLYSFFSDEVVARATYRFKGQYRELKTIRVLNRGEQAEEAFVEAIMTGEINSITLTNNAQVASYLKDLNTRTGGHIEVPDLRNWYRRHLKGVVSRDQLFRLSDQQIVLNIDSYCPPEYRQEIDEKYPLRFEVHGYILYINYVYEEASMSSDGLEKYEARIIVPAEFTDITEEDLPQIGENGRPRVLFQISKYGFKKPDIYTSLKLALSASRTSSREDTRYKIMDEKPAGGTFKVDAFDLGNLATRSIVSDESKTEKGLPVKKAVEKPEKKAEPAEEIVMSDESREGFNQELDDMAFRLEILRAVLLEQKKTNDTEKLKAETKEIQGKHRDIAIRVGEALDVKFVKNILGSHSSEIEKLIKKFEKFKYLEAGFSQRFSGIIHKVLKQAKAEGMDVTKEKYQVIRSKVVELAKKKLPEEELPEAIEQVVIDLL